MAAISPKRYTDLFEYKRAIRHVIMRVYMFDIQHTIRRYQVSIYFYNRREEGWRGEELHVLRLFHGVPLRVDHECNPNCKLYDAHKIAKLFDPLGFLNCDHEKCKHAREINLKLGISLSSYVILSSQSFLISLEMAVGTGFVLKSRFSLITSLHIKLFWS